MAPPDPTAGPFLCPIGARAAALMRTLKGEGWPHEVVVGEVVALLIVLRPSMPMTALWDEVIQLAEEEGGRVAGKQ